MQADLYEIYLKINTWVLCRKGTCTDTHNGLKMKDKIKKCIPEKK